MKSIRIQCPAKINLNLKVVNKRKDGFHNIESVMQTISLFDYLNISITNSAQNEIILSGNSNEIPYDSANLVYKAAQLFLDYTGIKDFAIRITIEKNIPISAGLAGGSTDAAGTLYGLNKLFENILSTQELHKICSQLGSDLNVCLAGGRILAKGRGEIIKPLDFEPFCVSLIKPKDLGISAKEAYTKFAAKIADTDEKRAKFVNDLEWAIIDSYPQLQYIKNKYPNAIMTGSGSTYFLPNSNFEKEENFIVHNNLSAINFGVCEV